MERKHRVGKACGRAAGRALWLAAALAAVMAPVHGEDLTIDASTPLVQDVDAEFGERLVLMGVVAAVTDTKSVSPATEHSGNTVVVDAAFNNAVASIYGGALASGDENISGNSLTVDAGAVVGRAVAGNALGKGTISGNYVSFSGIASGVSAGYATGGDAYGNTVDFDGTSASLSAAQSEDGVARDNNLNITGGSAGMVFGGASDNNSVKDNTVTITGGTFVAIPIYGVIPVPAPMIHGGYTMAGAVASGNTVDFAGATLSSAMDNNGTLTGGFNGGGNANNNTVIIRSGAIYGGGGDDGQGIYGGFSVAGNANGNTLEFKGGAASGDVAGGLALAGNTRNNVVTVSGGTHTVDLSSGFSISGGHATGNVLNIEGGTFNTTEGSGAGSAISGNATGNVTNISGGTVNGPAIYGGLGGLMTPGVATANTVNVSGGTVIGAIVGGATREGSAVGNTVHLSGSPDLSAAMLMGGMDLGVDAIDVVSGNRLVVDGFRGQILGAMNFAEYRFNIDDTVADSAVILNSASTINLAGATVTLGGISADTLLQNTNSITLFNDATGYDGPSVLSAGMNIATLYDFTITDSGALIATLAGNRANPQTKALAESRAAGMSFLNHASDMLLGTGMDAALAASRDSGGLTAFAAMEGMNKRTKTGSHVDVHGFSLMAGLAKGFCTSAGRVTAAVFFESGWGSYDSRNSFTGMAPVKGEGDTSYYGGGFLVRADLPAGFYAQAAAHGGWAKTDFDSRDIIGSITGRTSFDSDTAYLGANAALGYVWRPTGRVDVDFTAAYLWNRQNSDSLTVDGLPLRFDASNSHRLCGGVRVTWAANAVVSPFVGAAYEHELAGKAKGTIDGNRIDPPSLRGGTGIGEIGLRVNANRCNGFALDAVLQGYAGRNDGFSGGVRMGWAF